MTSVSIIPALLTESEVAARLDISVETLRRMRRRGEIGYLAIGRKIKHTDQQIAAYLENVSCPAQKTGSNMADTFSSDDQIVKNGAALGSTPLHDRRAAQASALATFKKRKTR